MGTRAVKARKIPSAPNVERRKGTVEDVVEGVRHSISSNDLAPGTKLREVELANRHSVSRAKVRDALAVLVQRGLVERVPNRGAIVGRLDAEQVIELLELRETLEGLCARLATQKAPRETWDEFLELFGAPMERIVENQDFEGYLANLRRLRARMIDAAASPLLADHLRSLEDRTLTLSRRLLLLPGRPQQGLMEHRAMLKAMREGNADAAEALRRQILRSAKDYFNRYSEFLL